MSQDSNAKNLDRIVSYPDSPDGLAYIRDTGILASEIAARMADANYSRNDISGDYPMLDAEDIQQALVYILQEQSDFLKSIAFDLRSPVATVLGVASLLDDPELTADERSQLARIIGDTGQKWSNALDGVMLWQRVFYTPGLDNLVELKLEEFVARLSPQPQDTTRPVGNVDLEINISNELPPIKGHVLLFNALQALLIGSAVNYPREKAALNLTQISPTSVEVIVTHEFKFILDIAAVNQLRRNHTFRAVVRVLQLSGSELKISPAADHVTFTFQLPVWSENEPV